MIYIASPYTAIGAENPEKTQLERYKTVLSVTHKLIAQKYNVFSPIVYGHAFAICENAPTDAAAWWHFNRAMLKAAGEFWILKLEGWESSIGIAQETRKAVVLQLPIQKYTLDEITNLPMKG